MISLKPKRGQDMSKKEKKSITGKIAALFSHPIAIEITVLAIWAGITWWTGLFSLPSKVDMLDGKIDNIETDIEGVKAEINEIDKQVGSLEQRVAKIEAKNDIYDEILINNTTLKLDGFSGISDEGISVSENETIATTSGKYTAKELQNQRIITSYQQDGYDIIFCGQYNENYHWDGLCVRNSYKSGRLAFAEYANYNDGVREYNEQLFPSDDASTWYYVNRIQKDNVNTGDTWLYRKTKDIIQKADIDAPEEKDLIYPDIYRGTLGDYFCHYHGDTSEGKYNDTTGEAYLLSYDEEGYIKTLYCGKFKAGQFEDTTGEAWYITRNKDTEYMYFKGAFKEGHPEGSGESENPVTMKTIENMTSDQPFSEELKWDMDHIK